MVTARPLLTLVRAGIAGRAEYRSPLTHRDEIAFVRPVPGRRWAVVIAQSTAEAFGPATRLSRLLSFGIVAILVLGSAVMILAARYLAGREHALVLLQRETERLAVTDGLTAVANRRWLDAAIDAEVVRTRRSKVPFALTLLDVDGFKALNDSLGHQAGDRALREVAAAIRRTVREGDSVARYGGDEFAVLHPACDGAQAGEVVERIRRAIESESIVADPSSGVLLTVSAGVAVAESGDTADDTVRRADAALYASKASRSPGGPLPRIPPASYLRGA